MLYNEDVQIVINYQLSGLQLVWSTDKREKWRAVGESTIL